MRSKRALYNVFTGLILQIIVVVYGFVVPRIIISNFGSNINGLISSITQFLAYITLLESGFGPIVKAILYKPIANQNKEKIATILYSTEKFFRKISLIFLVYIGILCFAYPLVVNSGFDNLFTILLILIISISTFSEYFFGMTYKLYLQADQRTYVISIIQVITYIMSIILIVILSLKGCSILIIKLASGIVFVMRPIIQNIYVKKKYNINFSLCEKNYVIENKWDGLVQHIASVVHDNTDITVLTFFCNMYEVSVYSVYLLVVKGIKSFIQAFTGGIDSIFGDMIAKSEKDNLNKKFKMYEVFYFTICTIIFSAAMILIVPFVSIYTQGINDANYIRPLFGYLIVISEYLWAIRLPYISITYAAGHFKETRNGAIVECCVNLILSIILVKRFGIIGVTIGTIVAMLIRTIEFIYHTNKYILKRNVLKSLKLIVLVCIETTVSVILCNLISFNSYDIISWIVKGILVTSISFFITVLVNFLFYNKEFADIVRILFKKKRRK